MKSGRLSPDVPESIDALKLVKSRKLPGSSWKLGIEGFLLEATHSQNIYHNNGPCDALEALLVADDFGRESIEGFWWLLKSQRDNGVWHLSSPDPSQKFADVWTWSTSEFIYVMNLASKKLIRYILDNSYDMSVTNSFFKKIISNIKGG